MDMGKLLLIGINKYATQPLRGCVNDVRLIADWAMEKRGFGYNDILMLTDDRAKYHNIAARLDWLCMGNDPVRGIWFSGHGAQMATRNNWELDKLSELICLQNFSWDDPYSYIKDDLIVSRLRGIAATTKLFIGSDSCHSGDLSRSAPTGPAPVASNAFRTSLLERRITPPECVAFRNECAIKGRLKTHRMRDVVDSGLSCGFISGCKSNQTSADAYIESAGKYYGAMTWYFVQALRSLPAYASMREAVAKTNELLRENDYDQMPQCEGPLGDLPFLAA